MEYRWKPFSDLPDDPNTLSDGELDSLYRVWTSQKMALEEAGALAEFNRRLQREWAIETGVIERVYSLDRGTTHILIERGINASLIPHEATDRDPELVARIIQDHADALEGLFGFVKGERQLTTGYIKELHSALLRNQETITVVDQFERAFEKTLQKGCYKTQPNNPTHADGSIHEYCPPEHVAAEMDRMMLLHESHADKHVPVEVEAAWIHHVFTQIHPFEDGNGRVARALASIIFLRASWFPLEITRDDEKYIDALEAADLGDLRPLVSLFVKVQKRLLIKVGDVAYEARPPQTVDEEITAVRDRLIQTGQIIPKDWLRAKETAHHLFNVAQQRLNKVAEALRSEIGVVRPGFAFSAGTGGPGEFPEPAGVAKQVGYTPNFAEYHRWAVLMFKTERSGKIVISFHALGLTFRGLVAVLAYFKQDDADPVLASEDAFQINYEEDRTHAEKRFQPWLEKALLAGLKSWRQTL